MKTSNILPYSAEQGVQGRVVVQFVVGVHGEILNPVVVKSVGSVSRTRKQSA